MEFLILTVALFVGAIIGWHLRERHAMRIVNRMLANAEKMEIRESIKIKVEKEKEHLYAYNAENHSFMGQAHDFDTLDKILTEKFPGKRFLITEENLKEIGVGHESV